MYPFNSHILQWEHVTHFIEYDTLSQFSCTFPVAAGVAGEGVYRGSHDGRRQGHSCPKQVPT